jgi:hypothetical protein
MNESTVNGEVFDPRPAIRGKVVSWVETLGTDHWPAGTTASLELENGKPYWRVEVPC